MLYFGSGLKRVLLSMKNLSVKGVYVEKQSLNEKMLLISIVGALEAIKRGGVSINEAEKFLFSPHMVQQMRERQYSESIIVMLEKGCELEDVASLLPQNLMKNIEEMEEEALELMKSYKVFEETFWI